MNHDRRRSTVAALNLAFGLFGGASLAFGHWILQDPHWAWPAGLDPSWPQRLLLAAGLWLAVHLCITWAYWRGWRWGTGLMAAASVLALPAWPLGTVTAVLTLGLLFWPVQGADGSAKQASTAP